VPFPCIQPTLLHSFFLCFFFYGCFASLLCSSCTPSFHFLHSKVRGKADRQIKANAVAACIALTRKCPKLWALLGEDQWTKPRGYSLLLQPFFLSPAINVGDIAVALQVFFLNLHTTDETRLGSFYVAVVKYYGYLRTTLCSTAQQRKLLHRICAGAHASSRVYIVRLFCECFLVILT